MSKIVVAGEAVVITSSMKLEDLRTIQKYRPNALTLMGGEDGKEPIFSICVTSGKGEINEYGASFGAETFDDNKLAVITVPAGSVKGDVRDYIADKFGAAYTNLNKLEETLPAVLTQIKADKEKIMNDITIAQ